MRVVLCHRCWTWMFPQGAFCSECKHAIALDEPDPTADELGMRLGTAKMCLGQVLWERPRLPSRGEFWGTTAGLLYWPLLTQQPNGSITAPEVAARCSSWPLFSLWRRTDEAHGEVAPLEETMTLPMEEQALGQGFLDMPGAAFFSRETVVKITCRGRTWIIHRTLGRTVRFTVQANAPSWKPACKEFFQQDSWRTISTVS